MGVFYNPPAPLDVNGMYKHNIGSVGVSSPSKATPAKRDIKAEEYDKVAAAQKASNGDPVMYVHALHKAGLHEQAADFAKKASDANESEVKFKAAQHQYQLETIRQATQLARTNGGQSPEADQIISEAFGGSFSVKVDPKNPDSYSMTNKADGSQETGSIKGLVQASTKSEIQYQQEMENFRFRLRLQQDKDEPTITKIQGKAGKKKILAQKIAREQGIPMDEVLKAHPDLVVEPEEERLYRQAAMKGSMDIVSNVIANSVDLSTKLLEMSDEEATGAIFKLRDIVDKGFAAEAQPKPKANEKPKAPQAAIDYLKSNDTPETRKAFEEKYGYAP